MTSKSRKPVKKIYSLIHDVIFKIVMTNTRAQSLLLLIIQALFPELRVKSVQTSPNFETIEESVNSVKKRIMKGLQTLNAESESPNTKTSPSVTVRNPTLLPQSIGDKTQIVDVHCVLENGDEVGIEMQSAPMREDNQSTLHKNLMNRAIHAVCRMYAFHDRTDKRAAGEQYSRLTRAMCVVFCDFILFPTNTNNFQDEDHSNNVDFTFKEENFVHRATFRLSGGFQISDAVSISFIELGKLKYILENLSNKILNNIDDVSLIEAVSFFVKYAGDPDKQELIDKLRVKWEEFDMGFKLLETAKNTSADKIEEIYALRDLMDAQHDIAARRDEYVREFKARFAEEKARADEEKARADEEKARADEEKAKIKKLLISFVQHLAKQGANIAEICETTGADKETISHILQSFKTDKP
ncbi:MAG: Rpn family recombination-promoting nuclease/putative transposase [Deltaproteobacteria bacterium]|jgi:hypothetical protein|nr:Rpn family recombination-promoting nuclease/putative transposase [Deltaproteobacteria bacterium]